MTFDAVTKPRTLSKQPASWAEISINIHKKSRAKRVVTSLIIYIFTKAFSLLYSMIILEYFRQAGGENIKGLARTFVSGRAQAAHVMSVYYSKETCALYWYFWLCICFGNCVLYKQHRILKCMWCKRPLTFWPLAYMLIRPNLLTGVGRKGISTPSSSLEHGRLFLPLKANYTRRFNDW